MPGGSWVTGILGYIAIIATWAQQVFIEQSIPQNRQEWITFILGNIGGLIGIFAKDFNKSNSPTPVETKTVSS